MTAAYNDEPAPTPPCQCDDLLNLLQALRSQIELRTALEGLGPCSMDVIEGCAEGHVGFGARDFSFNGLHFGERLEVCLEPVASLVSSPTAVIESRHGYGHT
jgi:hypothetical protein